MDKVRAYFGGGLLPLLLIVAVFVIFAISGAGSGVVEFEPEPRPVEQQPSNPPRLPLPIEINWAWFYGILLATTIVSLSILAFLTWRRPRFGPDYHAPVEVSKYDKEFQELATLLSLDPDPTRAIRLIFETAETKIEHLPKRVAPETPFEWSDRVKSRQPHLGAPLDQLSSCYAKARFAPGDATPHERDVALQALRQLKHLSDSIVVPEPRLPVLPWA